MINTINLNTWRYFFQILNKVSYTNLQKILGVCWKWTEHLNDYKTSGVNLWVMILESSYIKSQGKTGVCHICATNFEGCINQNAIVGVSRISQPIHSNYDVFIQLQIYPCLKRYYVQRGRVLCVRVQQYLSSRNYRTNDA